MSNVEPILREIRELNAYLAAARESRLSGGEIVLPEGDLPE